MLAPRQKEEKNTQRFSKHLPVRADLDDRDPCHSVTMHYGVEDGCRTPPPRQQAGVNIQNPAATKECVTRNNLYTVPQVMLYVQIDTIRCVLYVCLCVKKADRKKVHTHIFRQLGQS